MYFHPPVFGDLLIEVALLLLFAVLFLLLIRAIIRWLNRH